MVVDEDNCNTIFLERVIQISCYLKICCTSGLASYLVWGGGGGGGAMPGNKVCCMHGHISDNDKGQPLEMSLFARDLWKLFEYLQYKIVFL